VVRSQLRKYHKITIEGISKDANIRKESTVSIGLHSII